METENRCIRFVGEALKKRGVDGSPNLRLIVFHGVRNETSTKPEEEAPN